MRAAVVFLFILCAPINIWAQTLMYEQKVTPNHITLGSPFKYTITLHGINQGVRLDPPSKMDMLGPFSVENVDIDRIEEANDKQKVTLSFLLKIFDVGTFNIPTLNVGGATENADDAIVLPSLSVTIQSVLSPTGNAASKSSFGPMVLTLDTMSIVIIIVLLMSVVFCGWLIYYWFWGRSKKKEAKNISVEPVDIRTPEQIALEALERLYQEGLLEVGKDKLHYLKLTEILKSYLSSIFDIKLVEMTTQEVSEALSAHVKEQTLRRINKVLSQCDIVKFAKAKLSSADHEDIRERSVDLIQRMSTDNDF